MHGSECAGGAFSAAPGTNNGQNYTPSRHCTNYQYRRTVTSDGCATSLSNVIQVTVNAALLFQMQDLIRDH
ncbi:hypothetical protein [Chitinophaga pinensis]|uniref:Uncharacterized protein n=1 Tax=Chitinophaga pinensis TaxID=79329 RepID=A0A5C6LR79_9BACT|nr:hypothetical protein [Chitinophaga pinensis]TWV96315.1 hypothetical protein FEF09_23400 [Chitinophaga pinensis]